MIKSYKVQGDIKAYGLTDWWLNDLTENEREMFRREYKPLGRSKDFVKIIFK